MKKILLFVVAMLISVASFAQKKGDMYVSGFFSTDLGAYSVNSSDWHPFDSSFELGADYGYFLADNLRLGLELSVPFTSSLNEDMVGESYRYNTTILSISPNVAYYVKMGETCYYTPEFGVAYQRDNSKTKGTELFESSSHASTWGAYLDILAFEFKVSEKFSIGTNVGGIGFASSNYAYSETETYRINQFVCDFSNVIVDFRFYF
jgi:hypothetical protein